MKQIQVEIGEWSQQNFGNNQSKADPNITLGSVAALLGAMEELGELSHVVLKRHQGIRGYLDDTKYETERNDAIADVLIYLCDFAYREDVDIERIFRETWERAVRKRNWKESPDTAADVESAD